MWKFIPLFILPSVIIYFFLGSARWAILSLGLIPLSIIVRDMRLLIFSQEWKMIREVWKHMTFVERDQMRRLTFTMTTRPEWLITEALLLVLFFFDLFFDLDIIFVILSGLTLMAITSEILIRTQSMKSFIDLALSTEYAKGKGWSQDPSQEPLTGHD